MTPDRYRRIGALYHEALELEPDRRESFLREACSGDEPLFEEVVSLLAAHAAEPDFLAQPLLDTEAETSTVTTGYRKTCPRCGNRYSGTAVLCPTDGEVLDDAPEGLVGATLDGLYRVEALIGRGGMGIVYRARHLLLDDVVAIKMLPVDAGRSPDWLRRFQREGRAARRFRHPNAVTVHELRINPDGLAYMVLEYVDGATLRAELRRRGVLPPAEALAILEHVADALDAAHAAGVVHRDVKPENVMLAGGPDGAPRVKLLDLGIAKFLEAGDALSPLTAAGQIVGTPAYMSPEQWGEPQRDGSLDVDARTDVYSIGVVAYELFAGRLPFVADSREGWRHLHASAATPSMADAARPVPEAIQAAIRRALSKDRADRHATAGAFVAELRALLVGGGDGGDVVAAASSPSGTTAWGAWSTDGAAVETVEVAAPANNLPTDATSFVGRAGQAREVERLLAPARLVTLTGMGGIGKTRLALHVARAVLAAHHEEAYFVELASLSDASRVADTIGRVAGVRDATGAADLARALASRSALFVLDNCEHLVDECRRVAGVLLDACPGLSLLATSREPLGVAGETVWRVPALDLPESGEAECDSVRLFVERASAARPAFALMDANAGVVVDLCRRLEGIPLAIELAAARVKVLSVEQVAARMADRFTLLRGGPAGAPDRQRALRAAIDWSYELLDEAEQMLLGRVSVFAGGWTIDAAEAVCTGDGVEVDDVLDLLVGLVDRSFVSVGEQGAEARYAMAETLRQYAAEKLSETGEADAVGRRHRAWYLGLAGRTTAVPAVEVGAHFDRLAADVDNIRAALSGCLDEDPQAGLEAVAGIDRFWRARGFASEGLGWIETFAARATGASPALRAEAYRNGGYLANLVEDYGRASVLLEEGVRLARLADDQALLAGCLKSLSSSAAYLGDFDRAEALAAESLALALAASDAKGVAAAKDRLGNVAWQRDEMERAGEYWHECLEYFRETGDRLNTAVVLHNLARVERIAGDARTHERYARECADGFRELGYDALVGHGLVEIGLAAATRGDTVEAVRVYEEALEVSRDGCDRIRDFTVIEAIACLAAARGETQRALRLAACLEATASHLRMTEPQRVVAWYERQLEPARRSVGAAEAARLAAEGCAMSIERAAGYALETLAAIRRGAE